MFMVYTYKRRMRTRARVFVYVCVWVVGRVGRIGMRVCGVEMRFWSYKFTHIAIVSCVLALCVRVA